MASGIIIQSQYPGLLLAEQLDRAINWKSPQHGF